MLNLESRREILGITVFQDAETPTQFFYLPGHPHITYENGKPVFDLFAYRKSGAADAIASGGFLNMCVDLSIGNLQDRIRQQLAEQFGDEVTLAAVPLSKGSVRVIALGEDSRAAAGANGETAVSGQPLVAAGPRFIENILGASQPSLDGDNRAIFSFSLSQDGTAFFLGALGGGGVGTRPIGVIYDLEYAGLFPAYDLEITIHFKSVYEYMRTRFTLGTLFFRADIDNITEELQRREAIKIKEVARTLELSTPEAIRERQNRIDQLVKDLAGGAMFQPSLTPGQPRVSGETMTAENPATAVGSGSSALNEAVRIGPSAAAVVGMGEALEPGLGRRTQGTATGGGTGTTTGGQTGGGATGGGQQGGTPATGGGGTPAPPPRSAADVWNQMGRPQAAFVLKQVRQEEERTVTYNLSQVSAQKRTYAPQSFVQFLANARDMDEHVHIIDLNHPFFERLNINVNAANIDFTHQGIVQIAVQLRYGTRTDGTQFKDSAETILRATADSKDFSFFLDKKLTREYEYKLIVDYRSDFGVGLQTPRVETGWMKTEAVSLAVHPNWLGNLLPLNISLAPNLPADVSAVQVTVRYRNAAAGVDDSTLVKLDSQNRSQIVPLRLSAADDRFEITQTFFFADGSTKEIAALMLPDPANGDAEDAFIINAPHADRLEADVLMQDPLNELSSVIVDLQALRNNSLIESKSLELTTAGKLERWSVRLSNENELLILRYQERRIYKDGGLETEVWREAQTANIVVGIPAEGVLRVTVNYLPLGTTLAALGIAALLLDLEYKAADGDERFTQNAALLISDDAQTHTQEWKVRLADRQMRDYRWRLTVMNSDGSETAAEFQTSNRDRLVLRAPQH